jgi:hypothetical protein
MFFKKNIATDDHVHHARMSERAIIFNVVACAAWWSLVKPFSAGSFFFIPIAFIVVLYVHLSGVVYSFVLAGKCRMYGRAASVFVVSAAPLIAIASVIIWGGAS